MKKSTYTPPYTITSEIVRLVSEISEAIGHFTAMDQMNQTPMLRRGNRLRTIQASLAIENNSLSLEQVTGIINGKRIIGPPREIREVKNAFAVYELLDNLDPFAEKELFKAHKLLMAALVDDADLEQMETSAGLSSCGNGNTRQAG